MSQPVFIDPLDFFARDVRINLAGGGVSWGIASLLTWTPPDEVATVIVGGPLQATLLTFGFAVASVAGERIINRHRSKPKTPAP